MLKSLPTIQEAKDFQARYNFGKFHLCWFSEEGFTMAHTNEERKFVEDSGLSFTEYDCPVALYLVDLDEMPVGEDGWYLVEIVEGVLFADPLPDVLNEPKPRTN
jgi:hypothetical protein